LGAAAQEIWYSASPMCATYDTCATPGAGACPGLTCAVARLPAGIAATGSGNMRSKVRKARPVLEPTAARLGRVGLTATAYTLGVFLEPLGECGVGRGEGVGAFAFM
jgi:hypothetical protein